MSTGRNVKLDAVPAKILVSTQTLSHNRFSRLLTMDNNQLHQYAVTYHCGDEWGEEMLQSSDLGHAVQAAHEIFPSSCRISIREVKANQAH